MIQVIQAYQGDDKRSNKAATKELYANAERLIEERLRDSNQGRAEEDKLTEDEIEMWTGALTYISYINPAYALRVYNAKAESKHDEIVDKLGSTGAMPYVVGNVRNSDSEEREPFYVGVTNLALAA